MILCIVVVLAKTCFDKFATKERRLDERSPYLANYIDLLKKTTTKNWKSIKFMYIICENFNFNILIRPNVNSNLKEAVVSSFHL